MPLPRWLPLIIGWRITTPSTPIPGSAIAHPGNTSFPNSPRVRFNGVNSRLVDPFKALHSIKQKVHRLYRSRAQYYVQV